MTKLGLNCVREMIKKIRTHGLKDTNNKTKRKKRNQTRAKKRPNRIIP